jgi:hypothetical protein
VSTVRVGGRLVAAALVLALIGCSEEQPPSIDVAASEPDATETPLRVTVPEDAQVLLVASDDGGAEQLGSADLETSVSSLEGGVLESLKRPTSRAWVMPTFAPSGSYPRAVVVARPGPAEEALSPGASDFEYGADVRLDELSMGRSEDNGNNVLQRGLSSDASLFKLEVDADGRPGCTVKGQRATVSVLAAEPMTADTWYRLRCERREGVLRILVSEYAPGSGFSSQARQQAGDPGPLTFDGAEVPFSVGGKVAHDGTVIRSATDQFNGAIGNAYYRMG